jgi:hypothetical protein
MRKTPTPPPGEEPHGDIELHYQEGRDVHDRLKSRMARKAIKDGSKDPAAGEFIKDANRGYAQLTGILMQNAMETAGKAEWPTDQPRAFRAALSPHKLDPLRHGILVIRDPSENDPAGARKDVPIIEMLDYDIDRTFSMSLDAPSRLCLVRTVFLPQDGGAVLVARMPVLDGTITINPNGSITCQQDPSKKIDRINPLLDSAGLQALTGRTSGLVWERIETPAIEAGDEQAQA